VLAAVLRAGAGVDAALWPAHPPARKTSTTPAVRRTARRLMVTGMTAPPAVQRGEGDVRCRPAWSARRR